MNVPLSTYDHILRKRYGEKLQAARQAIGYTQLDFAVALEYGYPGSVSQVERGRAALPEHDLKAWANLLRRPHFEFAKSYLYHNRPNIYDCMFGENPYDLELLPRSEKTIQPYVSRTGVQGDTDGQG
jgi:transcriptional regulator with XRE-family HTH domain